VTSKNWVNVSYWLSGVFLIGLIRFGLWLCLVSAFSYVYFSVFVALLFFVSFYSF